MDSSPQTTAPRECPRCRALLDKRNRRARERRARREIFKTPVRALGVDMELILQCVADAFKMTPAAIKSQRRFQRLVLARHIAMFLLYDLSRQSYISIGAFLNRDHSTVINGYRNIEERMASEPGFKGLIDQIRGAIMSERACAA